MTDLPAKPLAAAPTRSETANSCALSFIAGFVDTCVFVALFGLFTAHVTGNFVLIGAELVHHTGDVMLKLLVLPVFVLAIAAAVKAAEAMERRGRQRVAPFLYAEAVLLLFASGAAFHAPQHADDPSALVAGIFAAAAMGLQNALMRLELASLPSTTVMTMNVTQSAIDVVTMLGRNVDPRTDAARRDEARKRFARMWPQIVSFTAGAAAGAGGYALAGLAALLVPAVLCVIVALRWPAEARRGA
jgi:uncharacterized membrane protein YoaK (UPF0700 family)